MKYKHSQKTETLLLLLLIVLVALFIFSLFKNIAYPLLWNDETETVMHGARVLEFGYPKVHDGKNVVCPLNYPDINTWINKKTDAYIATGWGHSYFVAPFILVANHFENIYTKTAILRSGFALAGMLGLILFAFMLAMVFKEKRQKLIALNSFLVLILLSISLVLHLREVRYYSLVIFLVAALILAFANLEIFKTHSYKSYSFLTIILSILLFNTFYPPLVILFVTIATYQLWQFLKQAADDETRVTQIALECFKPVVPYLISAVLLIPFLVFFQTFKVNGVIAEYFSDGISYTNKLKEVFSYFIKYDFFYLFILLKVVLIFLVRFGKGRLPNQLGDGLRLSNFLTLFFALYILVIAKSFLIYERYFIVLTPVLALIIILDCFIVFSLCYEKTLTKLRTQRRLLAGLLVAIFGWSLLGKLPAVRGHIYEMFHQYKGPLDYAIPYLKDRYKNSDDLIIATNYEETAYMYYLSSKTIVGYVGNNLAEDLIERPDIIINRKAFGGAYDNIMNHYLNQGNFAKISFPVYDDRVNNIPELNNKMIFHRFYPVRPKSDAELFEIFIRDEDE